MAGRSFDFVTVDVFTDRRFGGNPLAVFPDARGLADAEMQAIAAELNLSETTFVLPPADPANTARVRIFNRSAEMPFAGHPNVGTAFVLGGREPAPGDLLRFEEMAGLVEVRLRRGPDGRLSGAEIDAPQPLRLLGEMEPAAIAACASLGAGDVRTASHAPVRATVGVEFVLAEVALEALSRALPDLAAFQRLKAVADGVGDRLSLLIYARDGQEVRSRMFAPLAGTWEDPATGSANATLGALLLSLSSESRLRLDVRQGEEMGRPSRLEVTARADPEGIRASVGGNCVPVLTGTISV
ncbi:MAG TPA: PhzF family phenazine biosynthesis protein [Allosphingosinicella sp.]|jgi:trans-2,3-dihydro-3-hydroxyanthranilate isomerase